MLPGGDRPEPPPAPRGETARTIGVHPGPSIDSLVLTRTDADAALASFRESCPRLLNRTDASGLTARSDWELACGVAREWSAGAGGGDARDFFANYFETVRVGNGAAYATGYFEPEIVAARARRRGYDTPIYRMPPDLVRARPGDAQPLADGKMPLGRYDQRGRFVAYHDRTAIEQGALMGRGLELAWAADPVEFFFLQIQGSGRLRLPDGTVMRIGYAGQNGWPYTGIGGVMRDRGLVGSGRGQYSGSMQGIIQYIRDNPRDGAALMRENRSFVFLREVIGDGPVGALGVPVRRESSVAADPAFVPLGAPVWLDVDRREADGLWVAQDTGGAIKGANRFDTFWGAGEDARRIAGGMSGRGKALLLLPKGTLLRLRRR
ncbi:MAG TPA: murein transglycosylase A [Novosphingobium sp.]|nr:murein transglycosylase A [Novosphingobium sp.]